MASASNRNEPVPVEDILTFCRLKSLIFVEDITRNRVLGYMFLDYQGTYMWYSGSDIKKELP